MKAAGVRPSSHNFERTKSANSPISKLKIWSFTRWLDARLPQAIFALASIQLAGTLAVIAFMWGATK